MNKRKAEADLERDRMPFIQIDTTTWVVMRDDKWRPKAIIEKVVWVDGSDQYLLKRWHSDPAQRHLIGVHETLEDANRAVPWAPTPDRSPPIPESMRTKERAR